MADDPTEDIIKKEVAAAAKILREDGHAVRLSNIEAKLNKHFPDDPETDPKDGGDGGPTPPPKKEPKDSSTRPRGGIWWGDAVSDE
jgi:hypothetical protein